MRDPHDVALDASGNIYVANTGSSSVTVYAPGATGNTKPIETISGRKTQLAVPTGIAIDSVNGDIYALNNRTDSYGDGSVTIYPPGANGNVRPIGVISGPSTQLIYPNSIALDASGNIYVTNHNNYVTVYPTGGTGDVAPTRTIEGNLTKVLLPTQVALDSSLNVYVANYEGRSATVYGSDANGNTAPIQDIHGSRTKLGGPFGVAVDADGDIYVASVILSQKRGFQGRITAYSAASNGNVRPIRTIAGHHTRLEFPTGITIH
jgi:sugar lactone lactonase YvrE